MRKSRARLRRLVKCNFVTWHYGILRVVAVEGKLVPPLEQIQGCYEEFGSSFRLDHGEVEELYLFRRSVPYIYCRISQILEGKHALIAVHSTDGRTAKDFIDDVVNQSGFLPYPPSENLKPIGWWLKTVEIPVYEACRRTYELMGTREWKDLPTALAEMHYHGAISLSQLPNAKGIRIEGQEDSQA